MKTLVKDWQIVSIIDEKHCYGEVLYATIITDETLRFNVGDYVCSSKIDNVDLKQLIVTTIKGSTYQLQGDGKNTEIEFQPGDDQPTQFGTKRLFSLDEKSKHHIKENQLRF